MPASRLAQKNWIDFFVNVLKCARSQRLERTRMKHLKMNNRGQLRQRGIGEQAQARIILLALVFFLMGLAVSALWFSRKPSAEAASQTALSGNTTSDVTHALARSVNVSPQPQPALQTDLAALDTVKRAISNVNSASLEQGTRILRQAAVAEFRQTVQELQARQKTAEQNFIRGQNNRSDEEQKTATKQLQELQAEQMEELKQIAAKSKVQIETFQQLKGAAH
jgi:hypothetical protein